METNLLCSSGKPIQKDGKRKSRVVKKKTEGGNFFFPEREERRLSLKTSACQSLITSPGCPAQPLEHGRTLASLCTCSCHLYGQPSLPFLTQGYHLNLRSRVWALSQSPLYLGGYFDLEHDTDIYRRVTTVS